MSTITGTNCFPSEWKAVSYYSRQLPAHSQRDAVEETRLKIAAGEIVIGKLALAPGGRLLLIDNGTRYAIVTD